MVSHLYLEVFLFNVLSGIGICVQRTSVINHCTLWNAMATNTMKNVGMTEIVKPGAGLYHFRYRT